MIDSVRKYTRGVIDSPSSYPCSFFHWIHEYSDLAGNLILSEEGMIGFMARPRAANTIEEGETMFKATVDIASEIAHDLNVSREFVWQIIRGMRYNSIEELEIKVCKAIVGH